MTHISDEAVAAAVTIIATKLSLIDDDTRVNDLTSEELRDIARAALTAALPHLGSGEAVPACLISDLGMQLLKDGYTCTVVPQSAADDVFDRPLYLHPTPPSSGLMEEVAAALQGMLRHSCVADSAPEDKDAEDHDAERAAARAIEKIRGKE